MVGGKIIKGFRSSIKVKLISLFVAIVIVLGGINITSYFYLKLL